MTILAILGPRSRPGDVALFQKQFPSLKVLLTPETSEVKAKLATADLALIFGGDGTLHRHLTVLVESQMKVLLVPSGSGNDFATVNGIRNVADSLQLFTAFLAGNTQTRAADLGQLITADGHSRYFSCCANVGLDADATRRANTLPAWLKARSGYLLAGLAAVINYQPQSIRITRNQEVLLDERAWFCAVSNTPIYGGGLPIAPQASIWDGELDVTCLRETPRWNVIRHYPKILSGSHLYLPEIKAFRATELHIETDSPQPVYSDGDFAGSAPCQISVAGRALSLVLSG